jgi:hypothetical protein
MEFGLRIYLEHTCAKGLRCRNSYSRLYRQRASKT